MSFNSPHNVTYTSRVQHYFRYPLQITPNLPNKYWHCVETLHFICWNLLKSCFITIDMAGNSLDFLSKRLLLVAQTQQRLLKWLGWLRSWTVLSCLAANAFTSWEENIALMRPFSYLSDYFCLLSGLFWNASWLSESRINKASSLTHSSPHSSVFLLPFFLILGSCALLNLPSSISPSCRLCHLL